MRGLGEGLGDLVLVAIVIVERDIARHVIPELRRAGLGRFARAHYRGQRRDVEGDRFGGVLGLRNCRCDHAGDRIADIAHLVAGERRPRRIADRRAVAALERQVAFEPAIAGQIGGGIDRQHARHRLGGAGVDGADHTVGNATAHHHRIGLAGPTDVVGVAAFAAHQRGVFAAQYRLTDAEFGQRKSGFGGSVIHAGAFEGRCRGNHQIRQASRFYKNSFRA